MANVLAILICGFLGGSLRYWLGEVIPTGTGFPWSLVLINLLGSGVLAWLSHAQRLTAKWPEALTIGLGVGGVGAFTTFSTFSVTTMTLLERQQWGLATVYLMVTVFGGLACSAFGVWCARRWWRLPSVTL
ncbi:fluoride efflux transporter FluC [Levilactobacillus huananensis]|uniref:fluoride efflux transporter FluC n=1 Tax=Levilactobacillus huananensis TaxID=2486019 RepID=UPI000F76FCEF|nr:CrcB family protein [Levilactobacillus huananensis]